MADLVVGFVTSAILCGIGVLFLKRCSEFEDRIKNEAEYVLISKEQYEYMKNNPDVKRIIYEQPQIRQQRERTQPSGHQQPCGHKQPLEPELPIYSETDRLLLIKPQGLATAPQGHATAPQGLATAPQKMIDF